MNSTLPNVLLSSQLSKFHIFNHVTSLDTYTGDFCPSIRPRFYLLVIFDV